MIRKILAWILTLLGIALGSEVTYLLLKFFNVTHMFGYEITDIRRILLIGLSGIIGGIIFYLISPWIINRGTQSTHNVENMLQKIPTSEIIIGSIGLIIGLIIANLISGPLKLLQISWLTSIILHCYMLH